MELPSIGLVVVACLAMLVIPVLYYIFLARPILDMFRLATDVALLAFVFLALCPPDEHDEDAYDQTWRPQHFDQTEATCLRSLGVTRGANFGWLSNRQTRNRGGILRAVERKSPGGFRPESTRHPCRQVGDEQ